MIKFERILFPVAFSPQCELAAPHVAAWARQFNAEVVMLHVEPLHALTAEGVPHEPLPGEAAAQLREFRPEELGSARVERVVRVGDPAEEVARHASHESIDLVMMPTHGLGPIRRFIIGSVTAKVLHDVSRPVWTAAHLASAPPPDIEGSTIVCAVDLDERGVETLRYAGALARAAKAKLVVAHAAPMVSAMPEAYIEGVFYADLIASAKKRLEEMLNAASVEAEVYAGVGKVAAFVSSAAKDLNARLVVIGRGGHGVLGRLRTHDYGIIRECACPVLSL